MTTVIQIEAVNPDPLITLSEQIAADRQAAAEAKAAQMAAMPDVAEVFEKNPYHLLMQLQHWFTKGYELRDESIMFFNHGFYVVNLFKPAPAPTKKAK